MAGPVADDSGVPVARVQLRVAPGSRVTTVVGRHGDAWKVRVAAAPEHGRANDAVCQLLARVAGVPQRDVRVAVGASSRDKLVEVEGVDFDTLARMLDAASGK